MDDDGRAPGCTGHACGTQLVFEKTEFTEMLSSPQTREFDIVSPIDGRIVATGTHADLMAEGGLYANLYQQGFAAS